MHCQFDCWAVTQLDTHAHKLILSYADVTHAYTEALILQKNVTDILNSYKIDVIKNLVYNMCYTHANGGVMLLLAIIICYRPDHYQMEMNYIIGEDFCWPNTSSINNSY